MSKVKKKSMSTHTHKCVSGAAKPAVMLVRLNGSTKILGSNAAAQYLGMRQQEFYRIVQNLLNPPPRVASYQRKVDAVKAAYPELFEGGAK